LQYDHKFCIYYEKQNFVWSHTHTHTHTIWRLKAKLIFVAIFMITLFKTDVGWGQIECVNQINNSNLEVDPNSVGPYDKSFCDLKVPFWYSSENTAHHISYLTGENNERICWLGQVAEDNCLVTITSKEEGVFNEGIFTTTDFLFDPFIFYEVSLEAKQMCTQSLDREVKIRARAYNSLINWCGSEQDVFDFENIFDHHVESWSFQTYEAQYTPSRPFNQLELYVHNGERENLAIVNLSDVSVVCRTTALEGLFYTQNTTFDYSFSANWNNLSSHDIVEYDWTINETSSSTELFTSTSNTISFTFPDEGSYTVCLSIIDSYKCCATVCQEIVIKVPTPGCSGNINCIRIGNPNTITLFSDLVSGPNPILPFTSQFLGYSVNDICIDLEGTLVIDVFQVTFENTNWYCAPGSEIRINNYTAFGSHTFNESHLEGCGTMWKGITMEGVNNPNYVFWPANLNIRNTTIKDAYRAVELAYGTMIMANNSNFINNYIGCFIPSTFARNHVFVVFSDCVFEGTRNLKPPYNLQPAWNNRSFAGIEANNIPLMRVWGTQEGKSVFKNLEYGIKTYNCGFDINFTTFEITDISSSQNGYRNYGIYEEAPLYSNSINNTFNNLNSCIFSTSGTNNGMLITDNKFNINNIYSSLTDPSNLYLHTVLDFRDSKNSNISISSNNEFNFSGTSVRAIMVDRVNFLNLQIDENIFNVNTTSQNNFFDIYSSSSSSGGYGLIRENEFNISQARYNSGFINSFLSNKLVYLNNQIKGEGLYFSARGSSNLFFKSNTQSNTVKTWFFRDFNNTGNRYCCNMGSGIQSHFSFENGGNTNSKLIGNSLRGFDLRDGTIIGEQRNHGNIFRNDGSSYATIIDFVPNPLYIERNRFIVDPMQIGHKPSNITPTQWGADWFRTIGTSNSCGGYSLCDSDDLEIPIIDPDEPPLHLIWNEEDAEDLVINYLSAHVIFQDENYPNRKRHEWENHINFYKKVRSNSHIDWEYIINTVRDSLALVDSFTNSFDDWIEVMILRNNSLNMSDFEINQIKTLHKNISNLSLEMKGLYEQNVTRPLSENFKEELLAKYNLLYQYRDALLGINHEVELRNSTSLSDLSEKIELLDADLPFQIELKNIYILDTKVKSDGLHSLSESDKSEIERIANLCTLEYGHAVYIAYDLWQSLFPTDLPIDFNHNCNNSIEHRTQIKDRHSKVMPNPTTGLVTFEIGNIAPDKLEIYNSLGQLVYREKINPDVNRFEVDLSTQYNGVYIFKFIKSGQVLESGKIITLK